VQASRDAAQAARDDARAQAERSSILQVHVPDMDIHMPDMTFNTWVDMDMQNRLVTVGKMDGETSSYSAGLSAMNEHQYDRAIQRFDQVLAQKSTHAEGALFWKAFSQYKLGKQDDSLATIAALRKDYPKSVYLNDAKVLEASVHGQPVKPDATDDEELKLLAIQGIMRTDPKAATSALENVLGQNNSLKVKRMALYVLALSGDDAAHQVLLKYAKGGGNPDLQSAAIGYLASSRGPNKTSSADLKAIYESTTDTNVRMSIINAYRLSGDKVALLSVAGAQSNPIEIRSNAIRNLTDVAAPADLWALYQKEENKSLRQQMVSVFAGMGATDQLMQVVKTEKDPDVRAQAIRSLGSQKSDKTGATLVEMYGSSTDKDTRKAVISALSSQNNAEGLVQCARKETSLDLKTEIVRRLSDMAPHSKAAADYLMEVIK
jgi:HEAT repeat protein